jgi:D-alanine-D-alanine ligase
VSRLRIAVVFGGMSNEHDISLISATHIIKNIPAERFEVISIGITKKGRWLFFPGDVSMLADGTWDEHPDCTPCLLSPDPIHKGFLKILADGQVANMKVDCVFPVLHGKNGEDGTIQGLLTMSGIPFVGCGVLSSAACMDKTFTHIILEKAGIKTADWVSMTNYELPDIDKKCSEMLEKLALPIFVKPANCGSSIGITKVMNADELKDAVKYAFTHDKKVIAESGIKGREVECAVFGNGSPVASPIGEIEPVDGFYDFEGKYQSSSCGLYIPARISDGDSERIREIAVSGYTALCCEGLARVDFFLCENGDIYLNEINTMPGFTSISMYPKLMEEYGFAPDELLEQLIRLAFERAVVAYE